MIPAKVKQYLGGLGSNLVRAIEEQVEQARRKRAREFMVALFAKERRLAEAPLAKVDN